MLVGAQRVDGGTAVVDDAVQETEFGGRTAHVAHADVDADVRQALLPPDVTQFGLQLLGGGLCVTAHKTNARDPFSTLKSAKKGLDKSINGSLPFE